MIHIKILGVPMAKQSAKFRTVKTKEGRTFGMAYQPKKVKDNQTNLKYDITQQLPEGHIMLDGALAVTFLFVFPPTKAMSKRDLKALEEGKKIYKTTKCDIDNAVKGHLDPMNGLVFTDDSRIAKLSAEKIYGIQPRTEILISELE